MRLFLVGFLGLAVNGVLLAQSIPAQPEASFTVFDSAMKELYGRNRQGRNEFGESADRRCIDVPMDPAPDAFSRLDHPLAWHMDFLEEASTRSGREGQLRRLEALFKVGLLRKTRVTITLNGKEQAVNRFSLTDTGWTASEGGRRRACFVYGTPTYMGMTRYEKLRIPDDLAVEAYEVFAKAGIANETNLPAWARFADLQEAFPQIKEDLRGKEYSLALTRDAGKWVDYWQSRQEEARRKSRGVSEGISAGMIAAQRQIDREEKEYEALQPPSQDEIRRILLNFYGPNVVSWPLACIFLPGHERLPVDRELHRWERPRYGVAIFSNEARAANSLIVTNTLPQLELLERLGILEKSSVKNISGEGRDRAAVFEGHIYRLKPQFDEFIDPILPGCLPLGEPSVDILEVKISERDKAGRPYTSYKFKLRIHYTKPPAWMKSPLLLREWHELREVLANGRACDGTFGFDRKTREPSGGAGGCWWAFDSAYEN